MTQTLKVVNTNIITNIINQLVHRQNHCRSIRLNTHLRSTDRTEVRRTQTNSCLYYYLLKY